MVKMIGTVLALGLAETPGTHAYIILLITFYASESLFISTLAVENIFVNFCNYLKKTALLQCKKMG